VSAMLMPRAETRADANMCCSDGTKHGHHSLPTPFVTPKTVLKVRSVAPASSPRTRKLAPSRSCSPMQHPSHLAMHDCLRVEHRRDLEVRPLKRLQAAAESFHRVSLTCGFIPNRLSRLSSKKKKDLDKAAIRLLLKSIHGRTLNWFGRN